MRKPYGIPGLNENVNWPPRSLATDWYPALVTSAYPSIAMLPVPRYYYRFHDANTSHSDPNRGQNHLKRMLDWLAFSDILDQERREAVNRRRDDFFVED